MENSEDKSIYNKVRSEIINSELRFPYVDFTSLRKIDSIGARYKVASRILTEDQAAEIGVEYGHHPELIVARYMAAKHIIDELERRELQINRVAWLCDSDSTRFYKLGKGRPVSFAPHIIESVAKSFLRESCNRVMFGEDGKIILPGVFGTAARMFHDLSDEKKKSISREAVETAKTYRKAHPVLQGTCLRKDSRELLRDRLKQLMLEKGVNRQTFWPDAPWSLKVFLLYYLDLEQKSSPADAEVSTTFTLFLSVEEREALDYFISDEFVGYVPCYFTDSKGNMTLLQGRYECDFMSSLLVMTPEDRSLILQPMYFAYAKTIK